MKVARVGLLFVVVLLFAFTLAAPRVSIERLVDLSTQYVNEHTYYDVTNPDTSALNTFEVAVLSKNLAYSDIKVVKEIKREFENVNGETERDIVEEEFPVEITATRKETHHELEYTVFTIAFSKPVAAKKTVLVKVTALYTHALQNLPTEITQSELQKNIFEGNHYIASVYQSEKQYTEFRVLKLVDQTPLKPFHADIGGQSAAYGPYNDVAPFSYSKCRLHFHNMAPFLTITEMTREIEVSHWGNIAVEEDAKIQNNGAKLKGGFSRLDYMHGQRANGVNEIVSYLPKGAIDVYYRDVIGNVSSSHVFPHAKKVKLELTPRFVIFGGWKSQHTVGYNLPTARYLTVDGSQHVLSIPFVDTIENVVIDHVEFKVILPEGSSNVQVTAPYPISTITHSNRVTYLDTEGRVVVSFTASNLVPAYHHARLVISYDFTASSFYTEPFLLIGGFFALFLAAIFYFKVNLQIQESEVDREEIDPEVASLLDQVLTEVQRRDTLIENAKKQTDLNGVNDKALINFANKISAKSQELAVVVRELEKEYKKKAEFKGKLFRNRDDQNLLNVLQEVNKSINALVDHLNNAI